MPKPTVTTNTGRAQIKKQGHTANGRHGSEPNVKVKGGNNVRELGVNAVKKG